MKDSGCYRLYIKVSRDLHLNIGSLGTFRFEKGIYVYSGSAKRNLSKRIERHLSSEKKLHWHVDYLLSSRYVKIINTELFYTDENIECELNQELLKMYDSFFPIAGFGSSDCRICKSHLIKINGYEF